MPGEWVLRPSGVIDLANAEELRAQWYAVVDEWEPDTVVVDLRDVTFIDSSGLSVLAGLTKRQWAHHGEVSVRNPSPLVVRVLRAVGLDRAVHVVPAPRSEEAVTGHGALRTDV
jgi:anti-anti-sigma factor